LKNLDTFFAGDRKVSSTLRLVRDHSVTTQELAVSPNLVTSLFIFIVELGGTLFVILLDATFVGDDSKYSPTCSWAWHWLVTMVYARNYGCLQHSNITACFNCRIS